MNHHRWEFGFSNHWSWSTKSGSFILRTLAGLFVQPPVCKHSDRTWRCRRMSTYYLAHRLSGAGCRLFTNVVVWLGWRFNCCIIILVLAAIYCDYQVMSRCKLSLVMIIETWLAKFVATKQGWQRFQEPEVHLVNIQRSSLTTFGVVHGKKGPLL